MTTAERMLEQEQAGVTAAAGVPVSRSAVSSLGSSCWTPSSSTASFSTSNSNASAAHSGQAFSDDRRSDRQLSASSRQHDNAHHSANNSSSMHQHESTSSKPFGNGFSSKTLLQTAPADPRVSRASLPPDYDWRAAVLLLRMAAAAVAWVAVVGAAGALLVWAMGLRQLMVLWGAAEAAFAVWYRQRYAALNAQPERHAPSQHDALAAFNRLLQVCQYFSHKIDARVYLSTWFCGADYRLIRRDNVAELLAYGFWYKSRQQMDAEGLGPLLDRCVCRLEGAFRIALPRGRSRGLRCMFHLWEPLRTIYRPLLFYCFTELLALLTHALLLAAGCSLRTDPTTGMRQATAGLGSSSSSRASEAKGTAAGANAAGAGAGAATRACAAAVGGELDSRGSGKYTGGVGKDGGSSSSSSGSRPVVVAVSSCCGGAGAGEEADGDGEAQGDGRGETGGEGAGPKAEAKGPKDETEAGEAPLAPVVFLHGVGVGLLPYVNFIRLLLSCRVPFLALEYKHVSMRLCSVIPSADEVAEAAVAAMDAHGVAQGCVVAHSYGTFVASRMAQRHPGRLQSLALLDPVCFGMFMPHLLANFIYRNPRTSSVATYLKDLLFSFVSRDLHCAAALCRRFYWSDVNLWPQDIPGRTLVALAGHDQLIHVEEVLDFVQHYAAKILYHPQHSHAQLLLDAHWQQQIVSDIYAMVGSGSGAEGAAEVERRLTAMPQQQLHTEHHTHTHTHAQQQQQQQQQPLPGPHSVRRLLSASVAPPAAAAATGLLSDASAASRRRWTVLPPSGPVDYMNGQGQVQGQDWTAFSHGVSGLGLSGAGGTGGSVGTGTEHREEQEEEQDASAFAAMLQQQIASARGQQQQQVGSTESAAAAGGTAAAEARGGAGGGAGLAATASAQEAGVGAGGPGGRVTRRNTATLHARAPLPDPEEALLLELAGAGLNRAILMGPAVPAPNHYNHHNQQHGHSQQQQQQQQQQRPAFGRVARHLSHMGAGVGTADIAKAVATVAAAGAGAGVTPPASWACLGCSGTDSSSSSSLVKAGIPGSNLASAATGNSCVGVALQQSQLQQLLLPAIKEVDSAGPATPLAAAPPYNHLNCHAGGGGGGLCRAAAAGDVMAALGGGRVMRRTLTTPL